MARWSDLATWRGPTPNQGGRMMEVRGLIIHIAAGWFEGTIAWQRDRRAKVSSHFIVGRDGRCAQMVDTAVTAWTQGTGNGHWLSSENEGFLLGDRRSPPGWHELSPQMIEKNAQLLARAHHAYGVPLLLATHPTHRGLGYHSMGADAGYNWGHSACPGGPIKAQLPLILARAKQIVQGKTIGGKDMLFVRVRGSAEVWVPRGDGRVHLTSPMALESAKAAGYTVIEVPTEADLTALMGPIYTGPKPTPVTLSDEQLSKLADLLAPRLGATAEAARWSMPDGGAPATGA